MSYRPDDRAAHEWTIPAQAAQWLGAGVDSIESGRLRPAAERARRVRVWFERTRRRLLTVAIVCVSGFLLWHVLSGDNGFMVYQKKRAAVKKLEAEIVTLKAENEAAARRVESLEKDPRTIEDLARSQLRMVRPGEFVYVQRNPEPPPPPVNQTASKQ